MTRKEGRELCQDLKLEMYNLNQDLDSYLYFPIDTSKQVLLNSGR